MPLAIAAEVTEGLGPAHGAGIEEEHKDKKQRTEAVPSPPQDTETHIYATKLCRSGLQS